MLSYAQLWQPKTIEEAVTMMEKNKFAPFLAGTCWTRLGNRRMPAVIDLSGLNLRYIKEDEQNFAVGAMATEGDVEHHPGLLNLCHGVLPKAITPILGVQFRNMATIGGSIAAKFGFSDMLPTLLALQAEVVLAKAGRLSLTDYLTYSDRDLLVEILVPKQEVPVASEALRKSASDFPYLTGSVRKDANGYSIYVGCRPSVAVKAEKASQLLTSKGITGLDEAAQLVGEEIKFQTNSHATAEYRRDMAISMTKRLVKEVEEWK